MSCFVPRRAPHTEGLIEKLSIPYPPHKYALFSEARTLVGLPREPGELRSIDALAVSLEQGEDWEIECFELKHNRADLLRELRSPEKSAGIRRVCKRSWFIVAAPWKKIFLSTELELPSRVGLMEMGTGEIRVIEPALERIAEAPPLDLLRSLLRRAANDQGAAAPGLWLRAITRPRLSRTSVGLSCLHSAPMPGAKRLPLSIACYSCAEGRPADLEVLRAVIEEATQGQLEELGVTRRRAA